MSERCRSTGKRIGFHLFSGYRGGYKTKKIKSAPFFFKEPAGSADTNAYETMFIKRVYAHPKWTAAGEDANDPAVFGKI
jgi:hypothetical protein